MISRDIKNFTTLIAGLRLTSPSNSPPKSDCMDEDDGEITQLDFEHSVISFWMVQGSNSIHLLGHIQRCL